MDKLLALQPHRYDFSFHKANSLRSLGRHEAAIEAIENAIANDPANPLYQLHKNQSLELLKKQLESQEVNR
jgi:tetratricopeptide (TPR) repeat protein